MRLLLSVRPLRQSVARLAMLALIATPAVAQTDASAPVAAADAASIKARAELNTCAKPAYPLQSLRDEQQGTVTLAFLIGVDGAVKASKIVKSSGFMLLDAAASEGIARCRFKPTHVNGKPEQSWVQMQYVWSLSDPSPAEAATTVAQLRTDAERGNAEAQYQLGKVLLEPTTPGHSQIDALFWLRKAAEQGHLHAQFTLGMIMQMGVAGPADNEQAMAWYRKAGGQGLPEAQYAMGMTLLLRARPGDAPAARTWLKLAAVQGYAAGQAQYGSLLMLENTPESIAEGITMARKAAAQNDAVGHYLLGRCYQQGIGVERDYAEAKIWYEKGALGGSRQAQTMLADLYERGLGVAADPQAAARWRTIANTPRARKQ